jgi:hypothetical protein
MNLDAQIECLKREVRRREKKYPHLVEQGVFTRDEADAEIARMRAAFQTLTQLRGLIRPIAGVDE